MPKIFILIISSIFILSCNNEDINSVENIKVSSNARQVFLGDSFQFDVKTDTDINITADAEIYVDNMLIDNDIFYPTSLGIYSVKASYNGYTSDLIEVEVVEPFIYTHKILLEDYTGTWCGYCPRIAHSIELAKEQSNNIVSVAVHLYDNNDIYSFSGSTLLNSTFAIGGLPEGRINRIHKWNYPENTNLEQALYAIDLSSPVGLAINSTINGNNINATIKVGFDKTISQNLGVVVYLTENGLIHDQTNYTDFYVGDPVIGFEHNDTLRAIYTSELGDVIPSIETVEDNIYTLNMSNTIPASIEDNTKLHLVAFVVDKDTNEVINVQEATVGENKDFD